MIASRVYGWPIDWRRATSAAAVRSHSRAPTASAACSTPRGPGRADEENRQQGDVMPKAIQAEAR